MQWSQKRLQERAEILFACACEARGYSATKLPVQKTKTPDFLVNSTGSQFVAEVKSPGLDPQLKRATNGNTEVLCSKPGKRVRDLIRDSKDQLATWPTAIPKVLVICDLRDYLAGYPMYPGYQFGAGDVAAGMFGETQFIFEKRPEGLVPKGPRLGGNRTLRPDHYTHVSALILLLASVDIETPSHVRIYHNPFADQKFPKDIFVAATDHHYRLAEVNSKLVNWWEEIR